MTQRGYWRRSDLGRNCHKFRSGRDDSRGLALEWPIKYPKADGIHGSQVMSFNSQTRTVNGCLKSARDPDQ